MNFGFKTTACSLRIGNVLIVGTSDRNTSEMKSDPGDQYFIDYFFFFLKVICIEDWCVHIHIGSCEAFELELVFVLRTCSCKNRAFYSVVFFFFLSFRTLSAAT